MSYKPKNILVTGAAGFIGCHFVREQLKKNRNIIALDSLSYAGNLANLDDVINHDHFYFIQGSIIDQALINSLLRDYQIETIVHFAAESHVDNSINNPGIFIQTNIVGTWVLLDAATHYWRETYQLNAKDCRFHHISTDEVYGSLNKNDPPFSEKTAYDPSSPYSASKASADHLVSAYHRTYGLPTTMSNCSNNYGSHQHSEKLIPKVIQNCFEETPIPIYGNGKQIRDWLYVVDHVYAIDLILEKGQIGEKYNIGGNNERTNISLVETICMMMDKLYPRQSGKKYAELICFTEDRLGHDFRYAIDINKISKELAWQPTFSFDEALPETIKFYSLRT
ncbi:MAG: dTDP-glucose 4,6-dehydratase [Legionellales bacterium]|nr:dTDP-glucose 4,6-dehydratase [Legionellales bacterium]